MEQRTMKALVKEATGKDGLVLKTVPVPACGPEEVLIRVVYAGVCGTDLHIARDEYTVFMPVIIGHEFSGVVEQVGDRVTNCAPGDRVVSLTCSVHCGTCDFCRQGLYMLCPDKRGLGSGYDGAFAEYMKTPADLVLKIPDGLTMQEAALSEPLASVVRAVTENMTVTAGDRVYVSGAGMMGQLTAQLCTASGADVTIAGIRGDEARLELAGKLCAAHTVDASGADLEERVREITEGDFYDVVFECCGAPKSMETCIALCRRRGQYCQIGLYGNDIPVPMDKALMKELRLTTSFSATHSSWKRMFRLIRQGKFTLSPYVGSMFPLERWEEAFRLAESGKEYKVLFQISEET